jgi:hypothetical protein
MHSQLPSSQLLEILEFIVFVVFCALLKTVKASLAKEYWHVFERRLCNSWSTLCISLGTGWIEM